MKPAWTCEEREALGAWVSRTRCQSHFGLAPAALAVAVALLPDAGHHRRVDQPSLAPRTLALDPFVGEPETLIQADGAFVVGVQPELHADQAQGVVGDVEQRFQ